LNRRPAILYNRQRTARGGLDVEAVAAGETKERAMAHKISDKCTACGTCKPSCPAEAIQEGKEKYTINADTCIDCGVCVDTCPVQAIAPE
jgi:ferredoxin